MKKFKIIIKTKSKNYPIIIGENILGKTGNLINNQIPSCKKIALIIDNKVPKKILLQVKNSIKNFDNLYIKLNTSEKIKNFKIVSKLINKLLKKIEEIICLHVEKQIEAGANIIQIFDSWAGLLPEKELLNYCYIPTLKVVEHIKSLKVPVICFPKGIGKNYIDFCSAVKPSCISIDHEVDPQWIKEKLNGTPIQGGLDPKILLTDNEKIKKNVEKYLNIFKDYPYIFSLGHGVLPGTKPETIEYLIKIVREKK